MPILDGTQVLVTRPAHQAGPLCQLIKDAGGLPLPYPVLSIIGPPEPQVVRNTLAHLNRYHITIFISPNAVERGLDFMLEAGPLPEGLSIACVGKGSAKSLELRLGRGPDIVPQERFDSEALLALPALQEIAGKQILIVRGVGGRELLAETLRERGAIVDYLEVYRRALPEPPASWPPGFDIITVTSSEGLRNLVTLAGTAHREQLFGSPLVVVSERTAELAHQLGFRQSVTVADNASDQALLEAVARNIND